MTGLTSAWDACHLATKVAKTTGNHSAKMKITVLDMGIPKTDTTVREEDITTMIQTMMIDVVEIQAATEDRLSSISLAGITRAAEVTSTEGMVTEARSSTKIGTAETTDRS